MLLQFTLPNVRTIFILMIVVVASAMQTCAEKKGFVLTLKDHNNRAMHINSHGKVSAEDISLAQFFTMDSVGDVMDFMDFKITIYAGDVNYFLCYHQGRLVGKRNATKDCHFRESMVNGHHQYTHAYNPVLHVGFKRNFRPVGPKDLAKPHVMKKATFFFFRLDEEKFRKFLQHLKNHTEKTKTIKTTRNTSTTSTTTTTTKPPSTTTKTPTTPTPITTTTLSPVAGTKRTRSKSRRPTSINSDSIPSESRSQSNSLKSYNQANSNNDEDEDLLQQQKILQRNRKQHSLKKQKQQQHERRHKHCQQGPRRTVGLMAQPQPKNLEVRHHHKNATLLERRRRRRLERQQHKLQRELWEREQRQAGEIEREREREEHHLPKAATSSASSSSSSSSSSTATSTALTATAASLAPSAFNLVAIVAASRRKRDRRKRSAEVAPPPQASSKSGASQPPPAADMQLVELPSQRQQPQNTEYSKPYVNSNLNNPLNSSNSINVNHAIPALPKNYNYLYSNEHYNLNTKSSTTDSSSLETSTKFDSPNSHSHSHSHSNSHSNSHSDSHSHSAFNQNIDNNLKQLNDRIEEVPEAGEREMKVEIELEMKMKLEETASEDAVVENRNHIDANNIIDDPNDEEHEELILNKLFRGLQELQQQHQQQQQQQQQQQPNIDNHNENINVVNNNQNHNDNGLLTNNNHNSNYNEQFANDDETIRIQNNKYETHIVQYKHVVFISKELNCWGGFF